MFAAMKAGDRSAMSAVTEAADDEENCPLTKYVLVSPTLFRQVPIRLECIDTGYRKRLFRSAGDLVQCSREYNRRFGSNFAIVQYFTLCRSFKPG